MSRRNPRNVFTVRGPRPDLLTILAFSGLMAVAACDKGPKTGDPTPTQKTAPADPAPADPAAADPAPADPAAAASADTKGGQVYGAGVDESIESVSITALNADPAAYDGKIVRVEGMVTDVCAKRGCWMEIAGEKPGEKARLKVEDGEMVFPMSAKGKTAMAQGKIVAQKLSLEETRAMEKHYAEEAGRPFDPESIKEGKTVFRIEGTGAKISN
jgi:hypothetical protein